MLARRGMRTEDKQKAMAYFESVSATYDDVVSGGILSLPRRIERKAVLDLCDIPSRGSRFLDVGCGAGFYSLQAKALGKTVTAVDSSPGMVKSVSTRVDRAYVTDLESTPFDEQYDLVVCAGVLDFVLDPARAFLNLAGAVAPGGRLVTLGPRKGLGGLFYRLEKLCFGFRINLFTLKWYEDVAAQAGLRITRYLKPLPTNLAICFEKP